MTQPSLPLQHDINDETLSITVTAHPVVNLALVHNGVPLVQQIQIRNDGETELHNLHLSAALIGLSNGELPQWSATVESLRPGATMTWDMLHDLTPSRTHLQEQAEAYTVELRVAVSRPDAPELSRASPVTVLAHNEWFAADFCLDSLATFVEPNDPAISAVLSDASDILEATTGDSSLQGYQAGPARAGTIAAAIYEALAARTIRYIEPPASFENHGQKIRSPKQVLDERFGTCLDLTTLYASCLEEAGLHPIVWIIDGHAFAGFMRDDVTLPNPVMREPNQMVTLAASGRAVIVEAAFYGGDKAITFRTAADQANRHLTTPEKHLGLIDVRAARRAGVKPFARQSSARHAVETDRPSAVVQPRTADLSLPDTLTVVREGDQVLDMADDAPRRVKQWKRALLDLSTRNRLLNLRASREVVYLTTDGKSLARIDDLVHAGKKITLRPADDLAGMQILSGVRTAADLEPDEVFTVLTKRKEAFTAVSSAAYTGTFKHLQRTARTLAEETGSANLYLTLGTLVHRTSAGREAHAPLFLLPVRLAGGTGNARFEIVADTSGIATPNYCLTEWLRVAHNVVLDDLSTPPTDESGIDIDAALRGIRQGLLDNNLSFRIEATAAVAICKFGTFGMWQDLHDHWPELEKSPLVRHLTFTAGESFIDPEAASDAPLGSIDVDEVGEPLPVHYDGSQLKAVELAAMGRTFVLQGPPGTGKSQTITNLIARNLAAGRTVLFVAEKQAALDVVRSRLDKTGLAPFTLNLHGANQTSDRIREQLKTALEFTAQHNDRTWQSEHAKWKIHHTRLAGYPSKVHAANSVGDSLWKAADSVASDPAAEFLILPVQFVGTATQEQATQVREALKDFGRLATPELIRPENPWVIATAIDDAQIEAVAGRLASALHRLINDPVARWITTTLDSPEKINRLLGRFDAEVSTVPVTEARLAEVNTADWIHRYQAAHAEFEGFQSQTAQLAQIFPSSFLADGEAAELAAALREAQQGIFGKKRRAEDARRQLRGAVLPGVELPLEQAPALLDQIPSLRAQREHVRLAVVGVLGPQLPASWDPLSPGAAQSLQSAVQSLHTAREFAEHQPEIWHCLRQSDPLGPPTADTLRAASAAWSDWERTVGATDDTLERWRRGRSWLAAWEATQSLWSADLASYGPGIVSRTINLEASLAPLYQLGLHEIAAQLMNGQIPALEAETRFLAGLSRTSMAERTAAAGLTDFRASVQDGQVDDFASSSDRMRELVRETLPSRLAAARPFDPNHLTGRYGSLRRSLDGKRNAASIRSLVRDYGPEIQSATPCFLVSPTSLAQYVPPGSIMFDLVVFDEASQVTVAQAIGAIGRAKSAVIVGDPKQMPPTMIGVVTGTLDDDEDDDADDATFPDAESILDECLESGVPPINLTWHYRSEDESLIAFSNERYYESKLATLPSPGTAADAGVELRRVNGHFNRENKKVDFRTNRVEAEAIVAEIRRRVAVDPTRSIGVVTFNRQQQEMILNLLEATGDETILALLAPDAENGLFVKNLENVQGDERDVILFSTAFSKKPGEDQLPLNFGPLTRSGGEKRLNVAITRARRKVIIFSSFNPSDIDLARTRSKGMADLRAYLETAAAATLGTTQQNDTHTAGLEEDIASALRERGFEIRRNYGMSDFVVDIAVRAPQSEKWQVAIMLDGPTWGSRATVNDRDLTPRLLHKMGWHCVHRVWLPDWLQNREAVLDRIADALESAEFDRLEAANDASARGAEALSTAAATPVTDASTEDTATLDTATPDTEAVNVEPVADSEVPVPRGQAPLTDVPTVTGAYPTVDAPDAPDWSAVAGIPEQTPTTNEMVDERVNAATEDSSGGRVIYQAAPLSSLPPIVVTSRGNDTPAPTTTADEAGAVDDQSRDESVTGQTVIEDMRAEPTPRPFVRHDDSPLGMKHDLNVPTPRTRRAIREAVIAMVEVEGPVELDELCGRIVRRFGIAKAHRTRRALVAEQIPRAARRSDPLVGTFVWPSNLDPGSWSVFQTSAAESPDKRKFEEICTEEIVNALEYTANGEVRDQEDLIRRTLGHFGIAKLTSGIRDRMGEALELGLRWGRLTLSTPTVRSAIASAPGPSPSPRLRARTTHTASIADLLGAGLLSDGESLWSRDRRSQATVHSDGTLRLAGSVFPSPSSAAVAANRGISTNGWIYWYTARGLTLSALRDIFVTDGGTTPVTEAPETENGELR